MESSECPLTICAVRARPNPPGSSSSLPENRRRCPFLFDQRHFLYQSVAKPLPPQPFLLYGTRILIYSHAPKPILLLFSNLAFLMFSYLRAVYYTVDLQTSLRLGYPRHLQFPLSLSLSFSFAMYARRNFDGARLWENRNFDQIWPDIAIFERCRSLVDKLLLRFLFGSLHWRSDDCPPPGEEKVSL